MHKSINKDIIKKVIRLIENSEEITVSGSKVQFWGAKPNKEVWDTNSFNTLLYLTYNACPKTLVCLLLNRNRDNLNSKVQKQRFLLRQLIRQISKAIDKYE